MVLISISMLDHTEGSFVQRPLCFKCSCQLLCGCCCGVASEEGENLEGSWLSTDSGLIGFLYSPGPMKQWELANMLWSHTPVLPEFGRHSRRIHGQGHPHTLISSMIVYWDT